MNFTALKAALSGRGFADVSDADLGQYINDAVVELDSMMLWPYLEASVTGIAPVIVTDLRQVDEVLDLGNSSMVLTRASWDELAAAYGDLGVAGQPLYWYLAEPLAGSPEIATFPTSSHRVGVQYWRTSPTLSGGTDTPLAPAAWHSVIVDMAAAAAYPDGGTPPGLQARIDRRVQLMIGALMADYGPSQVALDGCDS